MQKDKIINISQKDANYPEKLLHLARIPEHIRILGDSQLLNAPYVVGIVGSRKVTNYGREVTSMLAHELSKRGVVVISGLALGVDSIAHRSSLNVQGRTIAVLPSGISNIYPSSHTGLAKQIVQSGGLLISEYQDRSSPMKYQFIERNRIIAAMSDVIIITEAAVNSGSLHTARFALELGRTVMAVPGPITSPSSMGTIKLIQAGAHPILSYSDVLSELGIDDKDTSSSEYLAENPAEQLILDQIKIGNNDGAKLLEATKLQVQEFQTHISMLEIKGVIAPVGGKWFLK